ncbi:glycosyltransferase family 1 protein [Chryseolinea sp. H1M3-3]|uniref:glycosyltransferase family 4 protein n=1 Tax=Chryseolinea sp. H1M3-3 TaxID=3034144 RepID=UPI0023ED7D56|nr:glycosyltransferase family 1 protein [Chryseolinea sp. H1M3-3]
MKIGFDAKRFFNNFTGLGNYSRFVINALSEFVADDEYFLYSPKAKDHPEFASILKRQNVKVITPPKAYTFSHTSSLWRSWGVSREATVKKLDVFHGLSQELPVGLPTKVKKVVTVHDLIFIRYPELYKKIDVAIYKAKVKAACSKADKIIATSKQTADDIIDLLKIHPSKIEVVYQGAHPNFKKCFSQEQIHSIKTKYNLPQQYILNVGTIEERKNAIVLVKALTLLPKELRKQIVIIGRPTNYKNKIVEEAKNLGVAEWIIFLHDVPFTDLPVIYQGAAVFVYPSFFEGFGIPIVEALESSVPVISALGSCLTEAGGPGSIYIHPDSEEELAFQLRRVLGDVQLRTEMITSGKKYVEQFEPKVIAKKIHFVYKTI